LVCFIFEFSTPPALRIDGEFKSRGRVLSAAEVAKLLA